MTEYVRVSSADIDALADFLTGSDWPFHTGGRPDRETALRRAREQYCDDPSVRAFWIVDDGDRVGLIRLDDIGDGDPSFDLRTKADCRGRGIGRAAVRWITEYLFTELPDINRIEAQTRRDNRVMRSIRRCGFAQEAHYRQAWPGAGGAMYDSIGYAILRGDWESGTITPPDWDEHP